jgi:putative flippase GtrA
MATAISPHTISSRHAAALPAAPQVEFVVPVYNEKRDLAPSVARLHAYLTENLPFTFRLTIADNASVDQTWRIAQWLTAALPGVRAVHLSEKGRGRALRAVWQESDAAVLAYMDVDLSTDLAAVLPLIAPLVSGHSDIAIGTRLAHGAVVARGAKREVISRCYNLLLRTALGARFSDAQCGFKAIRADRARELLPLVEDTGWFFDTELLVLAERSGLRIHEVPVDWLDDPDSRVAIGATAVADLRGIVRLSRALARGRLALPAAPDRRATLAANSGRHVPARGAATPRLPGQLLRFGLIGVASTLAYLALYLLAREVMSAQWANALSLLVTAVANTAANRRLTFGVRGAAGRLRHQSQGLVVFALGLAVTSGSLFCLHRNAPHASRAVELAMLLTANVVATLVRFGLFRVWLFPDRAARPTRGLEP